MVGDNWLISGLFEYFIFFFFFFYKHFDIGFSVIELKLNTIFLLVFGIVFVWIYLIVYNDNDLAVYIAIR